MEIINSSGNQNKMKMSAKTEELMNSHPNLDSAPTNCLFENEEDRAYALGENAFHDAKSEIAPENDIYKERFQ
ncbi:MAG: hypothetical protein PUC65_00035 [Clostridiales bacterium]|nr:hypothetical protein [Clostridiales bacterium]